MPRATDRARPATQTEALPTYQPNYTAAVRRTVYLDHAATTPVRREVAERYVEDLAAIGNPSSVHAHGRAARRRLEEARESVAADLGAHPSEVVFTSGGTESVNLAIQGSYSGRRRIVPTRRTIVASAIEHKAVLDAVAALAQHHDAQPVLVAPDRDGVTAAAAVAAALETAPGRPAVAAVMAANNEVGTIQPVAEIVQVCRSVGVPLHVDAVAAAAHQRIDFAALGADLLAVSGHKLGAPTGIGALLVRRDAVLDPQLFGGAQERGLRAGTVHVAGATALAHALALAYENLEQENARLTDLRDALLAGATALDGVHATVAPAPGDFSRVLPGHAHLIVDGCDSEALVVLFDQAGISVSAGSACQAGVNRPSHVVLAMGRGEDAAAGTLRVTLGHSSTRDDVAAFLAALPDVVARARRAGARATQRGATR